MSTHDADEVSRDCLVAVVTNDADLRRFTDEHWYRIPARAVGRSITEAAVRQAGLLALYQTSGVRDGLPGAIEFWGEVREMQTLPRHAILPDEAGHPAAGELYHLIRLARVERLDAPIIARRPRRITFLRTTRDRLFHASDINDLVVGTGAEERLWRALRDGDLEVERRFFLRSGDVVMEVDFALFQEERALGLLCGETVPAVNADDVVDAWRILRFSPARLDREFSDCLTEIADYLRRMREG